MGLGGGNLGGCRTRPSILLFFPAPGTPEEGSLEIMLWQGPVSHS